MTDPGFIGLIKRKSGISRAEFSNYWLHHHAPLGIPWALSQGCTSYIQYHNPALSMAAKSGDLSPPANLDVNEYDGGAVLLFGTPPAEFSQDEKLNKFFAQVLEPDELRFLAGPGREIARFVEERLIEGEKIVLVENGKVAKGPNGQDVVDMTEAWKTWEDWGFESKLLK